MTSKAKSNGKDRINKNPNKIKPKELKKITDGRIFAYTDALAARPDMVPIWPDGVNPNTSSPQPQYPANHPLLIDPGVIEKIKKNILFDLSQNSAANLESALGWFRVDKEGSSKQVAVSRFVIALAKIDEAPGDKESFFRFVDVCAEALGEKLSRTDIIEAITKLEDREKAIHEELKEPPTIEEIALNALEDDYIGESDLAKILAADPECTKQLPRLWKKFELDRPGPEEPHVSSPEKLFSSWYKLVLRWTTGTVEGKSMEWLPLKIRILLKLEYPGVIELSTLKEFFKRRKIPYPALLREESRNQQHIETHAPANKAPENTPDKTELDEILKSVTLTVENNNEINLQLKGKPKQCFTANDIGFRDNTTKQWKTLLEILQEGKFNLGLSRLRKNNQVLKDYESKRKLVSEVNKKLIQFLTNNVIDFNDIKGYQVFNTKDTIVTPKFNTDIQLKDYSYSKKSIEDLEKIAKTLDAQPDHDVDEMCAVLEELKNRGYDDNQLIKLLPKTITKQTLNEEKDRYLGKDQKYEETKDDDFFEQHR